MREHQLGFVYVLTNSVMPGVVKIGMSGALPEDRAKQLFGTGVPDEYAVAFRAVSSRYKHVEKAAHEILGDARINRKREFFRVTVDEAIEAVRLALLSESGFDAWQAGVEQVLSNGDRVSLTLQRGEIFFLIGFESIEHMLVESPTIIDIWGAHSDGDVLELHATGHAESMAGMSTGEYHGVVDPVPYLDRHQLIPNGILNGREVIMPGDRLVWLSGDEPKSVVTFTFEDYTQVFSRTWNPVFHESGIPLILNMSPDVEMSASIKKEIRRALDETPVPRVWAPRMNRTDDWVEIGNSSGDPSFWLPQLTSSEKIGRKSRKK